MNKYTLPFTFFLLASIIVACGPTASIAETTATATAVSPTPNTNTDDPILLPTATGTAVSEPVPTITLPISLYIIDDPDGEFSSQRTEAELTAVYERVNEIWAQANISFEIQIIQRLELPAVPLQGVLAGNFQPLFNSLSRNEIDIANPSLLNGFYAQRIGGANGIVPNNSRLFFVMDTPSVHDERVTSHEIGHILGLHHVPDDPERLLYSGTNGMTLSAEEILVARYFAQGMLDRLR